MFRKELDRRLQAIFDFSKTTYLAPSESYEQDTLFIEIHRALPNTSAASKTQRARVHGAIVVYSQGNRLPYGFFNKRLEQADPALRRGLMFYETDIDVADSPARLQNIHERRANFLFLYDSEYDPNQGSLTSVNFGG